MLCSIHVRNYALIENLEMELASGLSIITGETGAGKSILVGALSLILGQRADHSILMDSHRKCIVEGVFSFDDSRHEDFFKKNDLDFDRQIILRREILPGGKSRAFINDTPVNLNTLRELGSRLVDIHSQHHNLNLTDNRFQLMVVDTVAGYQELTDKFRHRYKRFREVQEKFSELTGAARQAQQDLDYYQFQFEQLDAAKLREEEQKELEEEYGMLNHAEEIRNALAKAGHMIFSGDHSILDRIREMINDFASISDFCPDAEEYKKRLDPVYIELKDIAREAEQKSETVMLDPKRLEAVEERLNLLYSLFQKHRADTVKQLLDIKKELQDKIKGIHSHEEQLASLEKESARLKDELKKLASLVTEQRKKAIPGIEQRVRKMLRDLGIPNARFSIHHEILDDFTPSGKDRVSFMFSANKKAPMLEISRVASGGELSRLMLSIKSLISHNAAMPTIVFDEVDAGVSGEIADKVGNIIRKMAEKLQLINITHLPQVAVKGDRHYLVHKYDTPDGTVTDIRLLEHEEKVKEIAKMLSGEELTEAALSNARELLKTRTAGS